MAASFPGHLKKTEERETRRDRSKAMEDMKKKKYTPSADELEKRRERYEPKKPCKGTCNRSYTITTLAKYGGMCCRCRERRTDRKGHYTDEQKLKKGFFEVMETNIHDPVSGSDESDDSSSDFDESETEAETEAGDGKDSKEDKGDPESDGDKHVADDDDFVVPDDVVEEEYEVPGADDCKTELEREARELQFYNSLPSKKGLKPKSNKRRRPKRKRVVEEKDLMSDLRDLADGLDHKHNGAASTEPPQKKSRLKLGTRPAQGASAAVKPPEVVDLSSDDAKEKKDGDKQKRGEQERQELEKLGVDLFGDETAAQQPAPALETVVPETAQDQLAKLRAAVLRFNVIHIAYDKSVCRRCFHPAQQRCSLCHQAYYCDKECQMADWRDRHRARCTMEADMATIVALLPPTAT